MCYLSANTYWFGIYFCIVAVLITDTIIIPICQIHNSSKRLYKIMSSLLAHTIELNDIGCGKPNELMVYSAHLVWFLRNLVEDSKKFMDQFATYAYSESIHMTWQGLVKIHYLYSLVVLSFIDLKSLKLLVGNRFNDPFNLYLK